MKAGFHVLACLGALGVSGAALAGTTITSHPVSAARPVSVRSVRTGVTHTGAYHPGGIYGKHGFFGAHASRGSYAHVWRHWGGSFHYGPVTGIYLGFFDNPWYWGYPVYYYGYPVYPYASPASGGAAPATDPSTLCGSWQLAGEAGQYQWVTAPCPLTKPASQPTPATPSTPSSGSPQQ